MYRLLTLENTDLFRISLLFSVSTLPAARVLLMHHMHCVMSHTVCPQDMQSVICHTHMLLGCMHMLLCCMHMLLCWMLSSMSALDTWYMVTNTGHGYAELHRLQVGTAAAAAHMLNAACIQSQCTYDLDYFTWLSSSSSVVPIYL